MQIKDMYFNIRKLNSIVLHFEYLHYTINLDKNLGKK